MMPLGTLVFSVASAAQQTPVPTAVSPGSPCSSQELARAGETSQPELRGGMGAALEAWKAGNRAECLLAAVSSGTACSRFAPGHCQAQPKALV